MNEYQKELMLELLESAEEQVIAMSEGYGLNPVLPKTDDIFVIKNELSRMKNEIINREDTEGYYINNQKIKPLISGNYFMAPEKYEDKLYFEKSLSDEWVMAYDKSMEYKFDRYFAYDKEMMIDLMIKGYIFDISDAPTGGYIFTTIRKY